MTPFVLYEYMAIISVGLATGMIVIGTALAIVIGMLGQVVKEVAGEDAAVQEIKIKES